MKRSVSIACALGIASAVLTMPAVVSATYVGTPTGVPAPTKVEIVPPNPVEPNRANLLIFVTPTIVPGVTINIIAYPGPPSPDSNPGPPNIGNPGYSNPGPPTTPR